MPSKGRMYKCIREGLARNRKELTILSGNTSNYVWMYWIASCISGNYDKSCMKVLFTGGINLLLIHFSIPSRAFLNPLSTNPTKWLNTFKQFVGEKHVRDIKNTKNPSRYHSNDTKRNPWVALLSHCPSNDSSGLFK